MRVLESSFATFSAQSMHRKLACVHAIGKTHTEAPVGRKRNAIKINSERRFARPKRCLYSVLVLSPNREMCVPQFLRAALPIMTPPRCIYSALIILHVLVNSNNVNTGAPKSNTIFQKWQPLRTFHFIILRYTSLLLNYSFI